MAYVHMCDEHNAEQIRHDADGKTWIYARAGASATALHPKIIFPHYNTTSDKGEMWATIPWDTAADSCTDGLYYAPCMYVGFPNEAVPSDNFGWFQVGGKATVLFITAATGTQGYSVQWHDATVVAAVGSTNLIPKMWHFGTFAATHDTSLYQTVFLWGTPCYGDS